MHKSAQHRRVLCRAVVVLATIALALFATATAAAQSPGGAEELARGIYRLADEVYEVTVQVLPSRPAAGTVHFVVTPRSAGTGSAVTDATVLIVIDDETGEPTYQSLALSTPDQPNQYRANLLIKRAGEWTVRVNMEAGDHQTELSLPLEVVDRSITGGLAGTIAFFVVFAVLVSGVAYLAMASRSRRRRRASQS